MTRKQKIRSQAADLYPFFRETLSEEGLLTPPARVLVAVSGGIDSVVLLHLLKRLAEEIPLHLVAAHFNHQLRGADADADEHLVRELCSDWHIPCVRGRGDVKTHAREHRLSIETAARELRYAFLHQAAVDSGSAFILTAHNAGDQAETVIARFLQGAGVRGLAGIPVRHGNIIRPLLPVERKTIAAYAEQNQVPHREDASNADQSHHRNRIRHDLLPHLEQYNPQLVEAVNRLARNFREVDEYLAREAENALLLCLLHRDREKIILETNPFLSYFNILQKYTLMHAWRRLGGDPMIFNEEAWRAFYDFIHAGRGDRSLRLKEAQIWHLPGELVLLRRREAPQTLAVNEIPGSYALWSGYHFEIKPADLPLEQIAKNKDANAVYVDAGKLAAGLQVRLPRSGDRFHPLNLTGHKNVARVVAENGIPLYDRGIVPLIVSGEEIVWVGGIRLSHRFRVTPRTRNIYQLRLERNLEAEI